MIESMSPLDQRLGRTFLSFYRGWLRVRTKGFSVLAGRAFASFGKRSVLELPLRLTGEEHIAIGDDVFIGAGSWLQVLGPSHDGPVIVVGDGTAIAGSCVLSAAHSVRLGRQVLIARNVYISDHLHAYDDTDRAVLEQGITGVRGVEICDGAWLGQNVVVTPGVRVGKGAVVGANSVVREDVPDFAVAVGAPARVIRELAENAEVAS
jgi:acetyltransferase-like isoleucine patch superfamily enzyme